MKTCPNCLRQMRDNSTRCRECGSRLDGSVTGDFRTDYLNVFRSGEEWIYIYSVNGNQVILEAGSIAELGEYVRLKRFPWKRLNRSLFESEVALTGSPADDCSIIAVASLERNPAYSNLDLMFR